MLVSFRSFDLKNGDRVSVIEFCECLLAITCAGVISALYYTGKTVMQDCKAVFLVL